MIRNTDWTHCAYTADPCNTVAVARKLGIVLHRMWRDGTDFHWTKAA